jgi:hypothetical protein
VGGSGPNLHGFVKEDHPGYVVPANIEYFIKRIYLVHILSIQYNFANISLTLIQQLAISSIIPSSLVHRTALHCDCVIFVGSVRILDLYRSP